MSGGGDAPPPQVVPTTTTQKADIPDFLKPFATQFLERAQTLSQQSFLPPLPGPGERIAPFSPEQEQGFGLLTQRGLQGDPLSNVAQFSLANTLLRDPTQNPLVDRLVQTAQGGIVDQFNQNVAPALATRGRLSGSFGNTGVQELESAERFNLARALGDVENQIRLPAFESERGRQMQAAGLAPAFAQQRLGDINALLGVGGARQAQEQLARDVSFQNLQAERLEPLQQLDILGSAITTGAGGARDLTTSGQAIFPGQASGNPFLQGVGAASSLLGSAGMFGSGFGLGGGK